MHQAIGWPIEYAAAAALLLQAWKLAEGCHRPVWDFAVEISELFRLGMSGADLRWLICQGFLDHSAESSDGCFDNRRFQPTGKLRFGQDTCFVLTPIGRQAADALVGDAVAKISPAKW